jgi:hypothetical protein
MAAGVQHQLGATNLPLQAQLHQVIGYPVAEMEMEMVLVGSSKWNTNQCTQELTRLCGERARAGGPAVEPERLMAAVNTVEVGQTDYIYCSVTVSSQDAGPRRGAPLVVPRLDSGQRCPRVSLPHGLQERPGPHYRVICLQTMNYIYIDHQ